MEYNALFNTIHILIKANCSCELMQMIANEAGVHVIYSTRMKS